MTPQERARKWAKKMRETLTGPTNCATCRKVRKVVRKALTRRG